MRILLVLAAVVLATSCKRHPSGEQSCDQAGHRVHELALAQIAASPEVLAAERTAVTGLLAPMRDRMVRACREQRWSAAVRACFAGGADLATLPGCNAQLPAEQRAELIDSAARR